MTKDQIFEFKSKIIEELKIKIHNLEKSSSLLAAYSSVDSTFYINKKNDLESKIKTYNELLYFINSITL
jgi:hypothetical protein